MEWDLRNDIGRSVLVYRGKSLKELELLGIMGLGNRVDVGFILSFVLLDVDRLVRIVREYMRVGMR